MPKFKIYRSFGYVGTEDWEEVEADNLSEAEDMAYEFANERVSAWAVEVPDVEGEGETP